MTLTARDLNLLHALCRAVRLFAWGQVRSWWPSGGGRPALRRLALLVRHRLLRRFRVHARPVPALDRPVVRWAPGDPAPDLGAAAGAVRRRWREAPRPTSVYVATRRCAHLLGGVARGRVGTPLQASHDLGVSAVYLHFRRNRPAEAAGWEGEDLGGRAARGAKKPDALVRDAGRGLLLAVEFGAGYPAARLLAFHRHCDRRRLAYEVW